MAKLRGWGYMPTHYWNTSQTLEKMLHMK